MEMQLTDYYVLFFSGMFVGMMIMSIAHLLGVVIRLFFKIAR